MAHYRASVLTRLPREEVFAYLSDFSTTEEWDPGVAEGERVGDQPVGIGTEFELVTDFMGRKTPITYRIVEFDPPNEVYLVGENATVVSRDRMTFEVQGGRTRVSYDADLSLKGPLRVADPLLGLALRHIGGRALAGLRRKLSTTVPQTLVPLHGRGLDGRSYRLPYDLDEPLALLVIAFRREQQPLVDGWMPWLLERQGEGRERGALGVYEVPVIASLYGPARRMIDGAMTRGIGDPVAAARTITVYTDVDRVLSNIALQDSGTIAVVLVERSGAILARESGDFEQAKADRLAAVLAV